MALNQWVSTRVIISCPMFRGISVQCVCVCQGVTTSMERTEARDANHLTMHSPPPTAKNGQAQKVNIA